MRLQYCPSCKAPRNARRTIPAGLHAVHLVCFFLTCGLSGFLYLAHVILAIITPTCPQCGTPTRNVFPKPSTASRP